MHVIEAEDLWKSFKVRGRVIEALRGLHLSIAEGEIFGLLGPNGAGKTTTLRILTTLLAPDRGGARIAGHDLLRAPQRVRACIGYVSQFGGADYMMTGRENLIVQGQLYGLSRSAAQQRAAELLEQLEMSAYADRAVRTYSGGQRRRLDLALGLVHRPQLLFLDEPGLGLDPQSRAHFWEEVRRLHAAGTTIFLTTHYLEEADSLCTRLAIIDNGQLVAEGSPLQLKQQVAGDAVTLSLEDLGTASLRVQELLRRQPFVREVHESSQQLQVYVERGEEALPALLQLLAAEGIQVRTVALARPSLDDVFLRKTGSSLRDREALAAARGNRWTMYR